MRKPALIIFVILILIFGSFQVASFVQSIITDLTYVQGTMGEEMVWRSGVNFIGGNFGDYLTFINENTPQEATIVIPPRELGNPFIAHTNIMQFFLSPREVINCTNISCLEGFIDDNVYILIIEPQIFPGEDGDLPNRIKYMDGKWGFIAPNEESVEYYVGLPHFTSIEEIILAIAKPVIWIMLISLLGMVIIRLLIPNWSFLSQALVGSIFSLMLFSLIAFFFLILGYLLSQELILSLSGLFIILAIVIGIKFRKTIIDKKVFKKINFQTAFFEFTFIFIGLASVLIAVGKGYFSSDGIVIWGSKGYGILEEGLIPGIANWGTTASGYPLGIPILIATMKSLFGEILPASKLIFPIFYLGLIFSIWELFKVKTKQIWAGIFTLLLISAPLISLHGTIAYANLPFTTLYLFSSVLPIYLISIKASKKQHFILFGVLQIFSIWVRPEGIYLVALYMIILAFYLQKKLQKGWWSRYQYMLIPTIIFIIFWIITSNYIYIEQPESSFLSVTINSFKNGNFRIREGIFTFKSILKILLSPSEWGLIGYIMVFSLMLSIFYKKLNFETTAIILIGLFATLLTSGLVYLISFTPQVGCDLNCWVFTGMKRYNIPGLVLMYIGIILTVLRFKFLKKKKKGIAYETE